MDYIWSPSVQQCMELIPSKLPLDLNSRTTKGDLPLPPDDRQRLPAFRYNKKYFT